MRGKEASRNACQREKERVGGETSNPLASLLVGQSGFLFPLARCPCFSKLFFFSFSREQAGAHGCSDPRTKARSRKAQSTKD